jgi:hypothetical protein
MLRVAVLYNTKETAPKPRHHAAHDYLAEYDSWETVTNYAKAIRKLGHDVVLLHGDINVAAVLSKAKEDGRPFHILWNSCEGYAGLTSYCIVPIMICTAQALHVRLRYLPS